jgi:predicted nucleic acid-binding protein
MTSRIVVDASVAVKWFVPEEFSDLADRVNTSGSQLLAPKLLMIEAANAFWSKISRNLISQEEAIEYLSALPHYFAKMIDHDDLLVPALSHACALRHPIYDLLYAEAARQNAATFVTADERLVRVLKGKKEFRHVVHLAVWARAIS